MNTRHGIWWSQRLADGWLFPVHPLNMIHVRGNPIHLQPNTDNCYLVLMSFTTLYPPLKEVN